MRDRRAVWLRVRSKIDDRMPAWRERLTEMGQIDAISKRQAGHRWTDEEVFKGLVLSILSNSTDWAKIQAITPDLDVPFDGFNPRSYARLSPRDIEQRLIRWFKARKAGGLTQRQGFVSLIQATRLLIERSEPHDSFHSYLNHLLEESNHQPIELARALGTQGVHKLPRCGIALSAEFLRNIGHDAAKPDRHICRAVGSFGWVSYAKWPDRSGRKMPTPSEYETVRTMRTLESLSKEIGEPAALIDGALWLLCARSGERMTNGELGQLA